MNKLKSVLINCLVLLVSLAIGLLLCEFGARFFLRSSDYLSIVPVDDKALGWVLPPGSAGYDKWGFRNREVPTTADIVAIGDSHTYGNCAKMDETWPQVLGRLTGKSVYNLALGGYGPNQYYYLFKTKALELKPKTIVIGFYMGDDFENAFSITYQLDYWAYLRQLPPDKVKVDAQKIVETPETPTLNKKIRVWLSEHSLIYQIVFHGPLLGRFQGEWQIKNAAQLDPGIATSLVIPEKNICEAFRPKSMLIRLDQDSEGVREGMRITFQLFKDMNETCRARNIKFIVAVIPTKEMVFADFLEHHSELPLSDVLDKLIANQRQARERVFKFFNDSNIHYVDPLPWLQRSVGNELYDRTATDMHPNKNGYRVIAQAISQSLGPALSAK